MSRYPRAWMQANLAKDHANVNRAITNATGSDTHQPKTYPRATLPGDKRRLRGIPVAGVCGTSPGTDPLAELIRKERAA